MDLDMITNIRGHFKSNTFDIKTSKEAKLVRETIQRFGMSTKFFDNNIETLVPADNKDSDGRYNSKYNRVSFKKRGGTLIHELFHMASNNIKTNDNKCGVAFYNSKGFMKNVGLNEGITDHFTLLAYPDHEYNMSYPFSELVVSALEEAYGTGIYQYYFDAKPKEFFKSFGDNESKVKDMKSKLDDYNKIIYQIDNIWQKYMDGLITPENYKKVVNRLLGLFISICNQAIEILESRGIDPSNFYNRIISRLNNSAQMSFLRLYAASSKYESIENVLKNLNIPKEIYL